MSPSALLTDAETGAHTTLWLRPRLRVQTVWRSFGSGAQFAGTLSSRAT